MTVYRMHAAMQTGVLLFRSHNNGAACLARPSLTFDMLQDGDIAPCATVLDKQVRSNYTTCP